MMKTYKAPPRRPPRALPTGLRRRRPRNYLEWKALRRWGMLPTSEEVPPGYLLRLAREEAGLTQLELAERLDCSQQAIAQAERWTNNPSVRFLREWVLALGRVLTLSIE